jgi:segregation and condensation protein B
LEALLFVADGPTPLGNLAVVLQTTPDVIDGALAELGATLAARGLRVQRMADRVQLVTAPQAARLVEEFLGLQSTVRLSPAALETLAIMAYKQPLTRPALEALRGVNCDAVLKTLLSRGLIEEVGRTEGVGRPILYGTTFLFLQHFGLESLAELPHLDLGEPAPPDAELAPEPESIAQAPELSPEELRVPAGLARRPKRRGRTTGRGAREVEGDPAAGDLTDCLHPSNRATIEPKPRHHAGRPRPVGPAVRPGRGPAREHDRDRGRHPGRRPVGSGDHRASARGMPPRAVSRRGRAARPGRADRPPRALPGPSACRAAARAGFAAPRGRGAIAAGRVNVTARSPRRHARQPGRRRSASTASRCASARRASLHRPRPRARIAHPAASAARCSTWSTTAFIPSAG